LLLLILGPGFARMRFGASMTRHPVTAPASRSTHRAWPLQAKAREEADSAVRVSPLAGAVPPYGTARLVVSFQPPHAARAQGFQSKELGEDEAMRVFDYVVQVRLAAQLHTHGRASAPCRQPLDRQPSSVVGCVDQSARLCCLLNGRSVRCRDIPAALVTCEVNICLLCEGESIQPL
jgi:hypothetical protein